MPLVLSWSSGCFTGVCFFGDAAMFPLISRGLVRKLNVAESNVSDNLMTNIAAHCCETVRALFLVDLKNDLCKKHFAKILTLYWQKRNKISFCWEIWTGCSFLNSFRSWTYHGARRSVVRTKRVWRKWCRCAPRCGNSYCVSVEYLRSEHGSMCMYSGLKKKKYDSDCGEVIDILFLFQMAMRNLCDNCGQLRQLNVSSVNCITDSLLVTMSMRLRQLTILDISWNCGKKDKILKPLRALDDPNKCSLWSSGYFSWSAEVIHL